MGTFGFILYPLKKEQTFHTLFFVKDMSFFSNFRQMIKFKHIFSRNCFDFYFIHLEPSFVQMTIVYLLSFFRLNVNEVVKKDVSFDAKNRD
eukprot:UN24418